MTRKTFGPLVRAEIEVRAEAGGEHPREVLRQAAAGDVAQRAQVGAQPFEQRRDGLRVDAGGRQQDLPNRRAFASREGIAHGEPHALVQDSPRQGVTVRVQPARGDAEHDVACLGALAVEDLLLVDDAHAEAGEVILARRVHPRQLRGLAAEQGAARLLAALRDATDDGLAGVEVELARSEVVEEKERSSAAGDHVVHTHRDQIDAD
jgi:hypothetical protein